MSRAQVKAMKRAIVAAEKPHSSAEEEASARACAAALLARSIEYGHARLAVLRLALAVKTGADIAPEHWTYCSGVTAHCQDAALKEVFSKAVVLASSRADSGLPWTFSG